MFEISGTDLFILLSELKEISCVYSKIRIILGKETKVSSRESNGQGY